jgi:hypothetical protein
MKHSPRPQTISWCQERYRSGSLQLRPPFQRKPVWSEKQRCALIESILIDVPIPEIFIQAETQPDGTELLGVVDGQQRLRTILQFIGIETEADQRISGEDNNHFKLSELNTTSSLYDLKFAELTQDQKRAFFQFEISVHYLYTSNTKEVEDIFKRLNKFNIPLRPQELRNATYHGAFAKLSETLADNEYWAVNRILTAPAIRRMSDIEYVSELLIALIHGPRPGNAVEIDSYYEEFEKYEDEFPEQPRITALFTKVLETIKKLFPDITKVPRWNNRADFYSLFAALGAFLKEGDIKSRKATADKLLKFAALVDASKDGTTKVPAHVETYAKAIEKGSNDRARRLARHNVLLEILRS